MLTLLHIDACVYTIYVNIHMYIEKIFICTYILYKKKPADFYMGVYRGMYMYAYGMCMYFYI